MGDGTGLMYSEYAKEGGFLHTTGQIIAGLYAPQNWINAGMTIFTDEDIYGNDTSDSGSKVIAAVSAFLGYAAVANTATTSTKLTSKLISVNSKGKQYASTFSCKWNGKPLSGNIWRYGTIGENVQGKIYYLLDQGDGFLNMISPNTLSPAFDIFTGYVKYMFPPDEDFNGQKK